MSSLKVFHLEIKELHGEDEPPNFNSSFDLELDLCFTLLTKFSQSLTSVALPGAFITDEKFERLFRIKHLSKVEVYPKMKLPFESVIRDELSTQYNSGPGLGKLSSLNHLFFSARTSLMAGFKFSFSSLRTLRWKMSEMLH